MLKLFGATAYLLFLLAMGTICLAWPRKVRQWALKSYLPQRLVEYVKSDSYLTDVRFCGAGAYLMVALILFGAIRAGLNGHLF